MDITGKGGLYNASGDIGRVEFESIMRREMHAYLQVSIRCPIEKTYVLYFVLAGFINRPAFSQPLIQCLNADPTCGFLRLSHACRY
jgi:hypothetical protein